MTGVFIALMALMSFGFGLIFRSTAAAIAAFVGVVFVLPLVMHGISPNRPSLPADQHPDQLDHVHRQPGPGGIVQPLSPVIGLLLMAIYAAIALSAGAVLFARRDA